MTRRLLAQPYETLSETWEWSTDVLSSVTNVEQRIARRIYPRETVKAMMRFGIDGQVVRPGEALPTETGKAALIGALEDLANSRNELTLPMWQFADQPSAASWTTGTSLLSFTMPGAFTPFFGFVGDEVIVQFGMAWFRGTIATWSAGTRVGSVNFGSNTGATLADLGLVVPLRDALSSSQTENLGRASDTAETSVEALLRAGAARTSVAAGGQLYAQTIAGGAYPVLQRRIRADGLGLGIDHGTTTIDNGTAFPFYRNLWARPAFRFRVSDTFNRYDRSSTFADWRSLLQQARGSQFVFFASTRRDDFEIVSTLGTIGIVLKGRAFFDLWNNTNLKALALDNFTETLRVRQVVFCELDDNGDSSCQFESVTGLSAAPVQVSLAFPVRLANDSVSFEHVGQQTTISFDVVTVDFAFSPLLLPAPLLDVRADDAEGELCEMMPTALVTADIQHWWTADNPDNLPGTAPDTLSGLGVSMPGAAGNDSGIAGDMTTALVNGRRAIDTNNRGFRVQLGGSTVGVLPQYAFLHAPTGDATLSCVIYTTSYNTTSRIFTTCSPSSGTNGIALIANTSGRIQLVIRIGGVSVATLTSANDVILLNTAHVVDVHKVANVYRVLVDGVQVASGTVVGLAVVDPDGEVSWSRQNTFKGYLCEGLIRNAALSIGSTLDQQRAYLNRWKTALNLANLVAVRGLPNRGSLGESFRSPLINRPRLSYWKDRRSVWFDYTGTSATTPRKWLQNTSTTAYNFLRASGYFTVTVRLEVGPLAGGNRVFMRTQGASNYTAFVSATGEVSVQAGRTILSAAGLVAAGDRIVIEHVRTPSLDSLYLNGSLVGTSSAALSGTINGVLQLSSGSNANGHTCGRYVIHDRALTSAQRAYNRAQLLAEWPDFDVVRFSYMGDDVGATAVVNEFSMIPVRGEFAGQLLPKSYDEPNIQPTNLKPAPLFTGGEFDPTKATSGVSVLWAEADRKVTYAGAAWSAGTSPPAMTIDGVSTDTYPHLMARCVVAGALGLAWIECSFDGGATYPLLVQTDAELTIGAFLVTFANAAFALDNTWEARATGVGDMSAQANDLVSLFANPKMRAFRNGRLAFLSDGAAFYRNALTNARAISGPMTLVLVGNFGATPSNVIPFGGVNFMRDLRTTAGGQVALVSTLVANMAGVVTAGKDFVIAANWNGASSTLRVIQDALSDLTGTVNPGDPAASAMTTLAWGSHVTGVQAPYGWKQAAIFLLDGLISADDLDMVVEGFKLRYGFSSNYARDFLEATLLSGPGSLTFLHNNSISWQLSFVVAAGALLPTGWAASNVLFECVNVAGNAGLRVRADFGDGTTAATVYVDVIAATTWTFSFSLGKPGPSSQSVVELRFTSGGSSKLEGFVDGILKGSANKPGPFTYSSATQDGPFRVGKGRGFALPEATVRADFTSQTVYLRDKWFPLLWSDLVGLDPNDDLVGLDPDDHLVGT